MTARSLHTRAVTPCAPLRVAARALCAPLTLAALLLCASLALPGGAAGSAGTEGATAGVDGTEGPGGARTGGVAAPDGAEAVDPEIRLSSRRAAYLGRALRIRGDAPRAAGRDVRIERLDEAGAWSTVATVEADAEGRFLTRWTPEDAGRTRLRAVVAAEGSGARAAGARASEPRTVTVYRRAKATWYGPGLYGQRTACGVRLTRRTLGVAHRRLPCGTEVALLYRGRTLVVPVVDRGPYARGVRWDLTAATARRLRLEDTRRIGAVPLR